MAGLTDKQQCFVDEYLIDLNATQAAIRAGYSEKTAFVIGHENLKKPYIAAEIARRRDERSTRTQIKADTVLAELGKLGFSDIRKAVKWGSRLHEETGEVVNHVELIASGEIDDDTAMAIGEVSAASNGSVKLKFHDKRAALVDIGRHLGMFVPDDKGSGTTFIFNLIDSGQTPVKGET